jgi:hypothetical protein
LTKHKRKIDKLKQRKNNMGKAKDSISWFGEGAKNAGEKTTNIASTAVNAVVGLAMVGAVVGIAGRMFGGK